MESIDQWAAIIPTRGQQRKAFTAWAVHRAVQNGYDHVYLIDYNPVDNLVDMYTSIKIGVERAIQDGCKYVSIIEDDDYYQLDYLDTVKKYIGENQIIGINHTTYYHLFNTGWRKMVHPGRSGLCCTSFECALFPKLPDTKTAYLDIAWWRVVTHDRRTRTRLIDADIFLGIKHGEMFGTAGGNGHTMNYTTFDTRLNLLRSKLDEEAFEFYSKLREDYLVTYKPYGNKYKHI